MSGDHELTWTVPAALVDAIAGRVVEILDEKRLAPRTAAIGTTYLDAEEAAQYIRAGVEATDLRLDPRRVPQLSAHRGISTLFGGPKRGPGPTLAGTAFAGIHAGDVRPSA